MNANDTLILKLYKQNLALITALREIAAMGNKAGSETAKHRLAQLGIPLEDGGYVAGKGFKDEINSKNL